MDAPGSSSDAPLDAIVLDSYEYARPLGAAPFHLVVSPPKYVVPKRFGLSAILGITTALSVLFGLLRWLNAPPEVYLFFGLLTVVCCLMQMFFGDVPRQASVLAGAALLLLFCLIGGSLTEYGPGPSGLLCMAIGSLPFGALLGYITGTCAAGVFLVMDSLEPYFPGGGMKQPVAGERTSAATRPNTTAPNSTGVPPTTSPANATMTATPPAEDAPDPSVRPIGPPAEIPVFNCRVLVSPKNEAGIIIARAAEIAGIEGQGQFEREALQQVVTAFKATVKQLHTSGTPIPWLPQPLEKQPGDQERFIAVHL